MKYNILGIAALALVSTSPLLAQSSMRSAKDWDVIDSYVAYIGQNDIYNSSGDRLTKPWQVIRQDRANFHRFGLRDDLDQDDTFFDDAANRETMETMLANGDISDGAAKDVLSGGALILVEVLGRDGIGHAVRVTTAR